MAERRSLPAAARDRAIWRGSWTDRFTIEQTPSMNAEEMTRRRIDLYNDVEPGTYGSEQVLELYAPDCRWRESPTPLTPEGRSGDLGALREAMELSKALLVDRSAILHEVLADGDRAVMRWAWSATANVDVGPELAPAGSRPTMEVASFLRVADGKIVEITELLSAVTWWQLGPSRAHSCRSAPNGGRRQG
jgi:ketosteroid isomerase-like protein